MEIFLVAGARPNFMKIAPIIRAIDAWNAKDGTRRIGYRIVHTGQHYDYEMSDTFFEDLKIPRPHHSFNTGAGTHAEQTAAVMVAFERLCFEERPDLVLVVGDVNSTLACSITAKKMSIMLGHVEAGLRSFDMGMPEEVNRVVTDSIADYLFVTEKSAVANLRKEGKPKERIFFVGHVMVDNLFQQVRELRSTDASRFSTLALKERLGCYAFLTLHRPSNVDVPDTLAGIVGALNEVAVRTPILFPAHPRTKKRLHEMGLKLSPRIFMLPPLSYKESLFAWKDAAMVITDSGGLQEETTALGVPCITVRENTERPITVEMGTNVLAGTRKEGILAAYREAAANGKRGRAVPPKWDGHAADRIVRVLAEILDRREVRA